MTVLHLIDEHEASSCPTSLALLADVIAAIACPSVKHSLLVVGGPDLQCRVESLGLPIAAVLRRSQRGRVSVPAGSNSSGDTALLHTMSPTLLPSMIQFGGRAIGMFTAVQPLPDAISLRLRMAMRHSRLQLIAVGRSAEDSLLRHGVAPQRIASLDAILNFDRLTEASHPARRNTWGVSDTARVVAVIGDPPSAADALQSLVSVGLAREAGRDLVTLMTPAARGIDRARRLMDGIKRGRSLIVDDAADRPWEVLPGCGAALVTTAGLSAAWAMAAGLPIVAHDTPAIRSQLTDGETGLLAPPGKVGQFARLFCRLADDPGLAQRLGRAAAMEAQRRYSVTQLAQSWGAVFDTSRPDVSDQGAISCTSR